MRAAPPLRCLTRIHPSATVRMTPMTQSHTDTRSRHDADRKSLARHDVALTQLGVDVRAAVRSAAPLLISGERRVGRLVARLVHERSLYGSAAPHFVVASHAALSEGLASFLAQPVPSVRHPGDGRQGDERWTLYIEDVDHLTRAVQEWLLRFLDVTYAPDTPTRAGRRRCTVRVIAATTSDLSDRVAHETFRSDLFYRLNVIHLVLPPGGEGHGDLPPLVDYLLGATAGEIDVASGQPTAHLLRERLRSDWSADSGDLHSLLTALGVSTRA